MSLYKIGMSSDQIVSDGPAVIVQFDTIVIDDPSHFVLNLNEFNTNTHKFVPFDTGNPKVFYVTASIEFEPPFWTPGSTVTFVVKTATTDYTKTKTLSGTESPVGLSISTVVTISPESYLYCTIQHDDISGATINSQASATQLCISSQLSRVEQDFPVNVSEDQLS